MCFRSTVLAKAVRFPGVEVESGAIDLSDNHPIAVKLLLQYLYEADYDPALLLPQVELVNDRLA